jgi:hypothetical protein
MPPGVLRISIAILMALPLSGVLVIFLVLVAEIPILSALLILGVLDISVVFGGYYLIRRSLSK